jgi:hypothetical protein
MSLYYFLIAALQPEHVRRNRRRRSLRLHHGNGRLLTAKLGNPCADSVLCQLQRVGHVGG